MPTETVHVDWLRDQVFLLRDHADYRIVMTQPDGVSGADLLPLSLIGCLAWDIIGILRKQREPVTGLRVTAESDRDPDPPWRYRSILIRYHFTGRGLRPERVQRAIDLSENKYCSIYATLRAAMDLRSEFDITEA